jgi:hypothetical protein
MIELTDLLRQAIDANPNEPVRMIDPKMKKGYFLVSEEVYERLQQSLIDEIQPGDAYPAIDSAFREGWDDPKMDDYDRYDELKR